VAAPPVTHEARAERQAKREGAQARKRAAAEAEGGGAAEVPEEDEMYAAAAAAGSAKKARKAQRAAAAAEEGAARRSAVAAGDVAEAGAKRQADRAMVKNRGLTRERKKIDRNPRAKNREKFRRAVIKRKGQVRDVIAHGGVYSGEATGIRKNVTHSTRFK